MNALKIDIDKKYDGAETARELHLKINNRRKLFNYPLSPHNKNIKCISFGFIKPPLGTKQKVNSTDKAILGNIKKQRKQKSPNILNHSNQNAYNIQKNKEIKKIELKQKDINNFNDFKKINSSNNDILFNKKIFNKKIKSILLKKK